MNVSPEACERTVGRVTGYLAQCGVALTPAALATVFEVIEEALAEGEEGAVERCLARLPRHFPLPRLHVARAAPPIRRSSIGYG